MKHRIFSLLALLIAGGSTVWAETTATLTASTSVSDAQPGMSGYCISPYNTTGLASADDDDGWEIPEPSNGSMSCATRMYSLPGKEYMHKLIPRKGVSVEGITWGTGLSGLSLKTDRTERGHKYKYVYGTAPTTEGTYSYDVNLSDGTTTSVTLTVSSFLQAPAPGMVWVSWNWFMNTINATNMTDIAQGLVDKGLAAAGYNTLVLDDAWGAGTVGTPSSLTSNGSKFPDMKSFVQGVKAKGIKVGIYSDAAGSTCGGYQPGSLGVEAQHIAMFDSWGIDFLKYDFCNGTNAFESYKAMGDAIAQLNDRRKGQSGKVPFVFNACEWGSNQPWTWAAEAGASTWRATQDAREDWVGTHQFPGVLGGSDEVRHLWMYAGVNRFNDLDMMTIGLYGKGGPSNYTSSHQANGGIITGLSHEQARSQMSIWSMLASPLSLSCDVRQTPVNECNSQAGATPLSDITLAILKNEDIIAINQDALGQQAEYMEALSTGTVDFSHEGRDVYVKDLTGGRKAIAIVNRGATHMDSYTLKLTDAYLDAGTYYIRNVWTGQVEHDAQIVTGTLDPYQTKVYLVSPDVLTVKY